MKKTSIILFCSALIFLCSRCSNEISFGGFEESDFVLEIKYDKQTTSFLNIPENIDSSMLTSDMIVSSMPKVEREYCQIGINKDGSSYWEINILEPTTKYYDQIGLTSGTEQEVKRIIYSNNKAYYFNSNNALIFTQDVETPTYIELISFYSEKKYKQKYSYDPNNQLKSGNAPSLNNNEIGSGIICETLSYEDEIMGNLIEKSYIDTSNNLLMKSELFNSDLKLLSESYYNYEQLAKDILVPTGDVIRTYTTNSMGIEYIYEVINEYLSYEIENNL
jgi:hypothetical protein